MDLVKQHYTNLCNTPSDINEHLPTLFEYAKKCESVIELGVRGCISSWAFIHGLLNNNKDTKSILLNDINECDVKPLLEIAKYTDIDIKCEWKNDLDLNITKNVDLTFIDTWHVYGQLKRELEYWNSSVKKYIILHDTTVDEWEGESIRMRDNIQAQSINTGFPINEITRGLWPAIEEFLQTNQDWVLHERYTNNNGLTILRRVTR
jgi:hypothetical protein